MKKLILSVATILLFSVVGCKTGSSDPKGVLINFMEAIGKKDVEGAKKYATKDSETMLGMIQMSMAMVPDSAKNKIYDKNNMEFGDAVINGDKATVPVKNKKSGDITTYTLKKEDGQWKVAFDKATMTEMANEKMKARGGSGIDLNNLSDSSKMMDDMNRSGTGSDDSIRSLPDSAR